MSRPSKRWDPRRRARGATPRRGGGENQLLLDLGDGALLLELGLDLRGLVLRRAGLHDLRRAVDHVLGFLQAKAGDLADDLDDLNLLRARFLERDRELGLLFGRGRATRTGAA